MSVKNRRRERERELAANFLKMTETKMRCGETVPQGVKEAFHTSPDVTLAGDVTTSISRAKPLI
jgi:hypothetical protein